MRPHYVSLVVSICCALGSARLPAAFPTVALKPVSLQELQAPTNISNAGDGSGRLFICEQRGQIRILQNGMLLPTPFIDLSSKIVPFPPTGYLFPMSANYDERGLLGLAFHPGYANALSAGYRKFYVFYSAPSPNVRGNPVTPATTPVPVNCRTTLSEFQVTASTNIADPGSERILLAFDKPQSNHNGGQLEFGPDGYLYFSTGDGGGANDINLGHTGASNPTSAGNLGNAQDKTSLMGKIHRIDPLGTNGPGGQYGIPPTNPFVGAGGGVRAEIYAYGLRNTWRFSFDTGPGGTGRLFAADVGQNQVEEIDIITAGGNYGWHAREGAFTFDSTVLNALLNGGTVRIDGGTMTLPGGAVLIDPIAQYAHPTVTIGTPNLPKIGTSIAGGYLYRGSAIPGLVGKYVFGDYNFGAINSGTTQGQILGIEFDGATGTWSTPAPLPLFGMNSLATTHLLAFGRDEQGEIYLATEVAQGPRNDPGSNLPTGGIYKIVPAQVTAVLQPTKDNTLFSESGLLSDGQGFLYAGQTGSSANYAKRRALLAFDLAGQIPAGATIQAALLSLYLNKVSSAAANMSLFRLTENWGEGASDSGEPGGGGALAQTDDATWTERFFNSVPATPWASAGGTYDPAASATTSVGVSLGTYSWTSAQLAADAQGWLNTPASNFGWILIGNEAFHVISARRFDSRSTPLGNPPTLQVSYLGTPPLTRRESWLQQYFPIGHFVDDLADLDGDSLANLFEYGFGYSPTAASAPGAGLQVTHVPVGPDTRMTMTFRRDPRAVDLTYVVETSGDFMTWTNIAQSAGGAAPSGSGYVSEADVPGEAPIKSVTVGQTWPAGAKGFARLRITH